MSVCVMAVKILSTICSPECGSQKVADKYYRVAANSFMKQYIKMLYDRNLLDIISTFFGMARR